MSSISLDQNSKASVESALENRLDLPEIVRDEVKQEEDSTPAAEQQANEGPNACEDPRFIRFFKMVQFGVPVAAVKQKMETEGLDPGILE